MISEFESAFRDVLRSVALDAATEAIHQQRVLDEEKSRDGTGDQLLLRSHEAAEQLAVSAATLSRLTRSGELPCVRVGRTVRYSTETLRAWIEKMESTDMPKPRPTVTESHLEPVKKSPPKSKNSEPMKSPRRAQAKKKTPSPAREPKKRSPKTRRKSTAEVEGKERRCPFDLLLEEMGVERKNIPAVTNGDLMRIAEVDIPTLHGWSYMNRELPEEALQRLRDHFGKFASKKGDDG